MWFMKTLRILAPFLPILTEKGGVILPIWKFLLAGAVTGAVNGFFGGGGGSILVPLLTGLCAVERKKAFATSVAVILPLCLLSAGIYLWRGSLDWMAALPYLVGGAVGGWLGGRFFKGVKLPWLTRGFGLLLILGGIRCLMF